VPVWMQIAQQVVGFFTNSFIGPMYATGLTLFYYDQRVRKEGFDIEWMMEAAGMNAPVPVPEAPPGAAPPDSNAEEPAAPALQGAVSETEASQPAEPPTAPSGDPS